MKTLKESLKRELFRSNAKRINENIKPADEKLFWRWIDAMGGTDIFGIRKVDDALMKAADLGTTAEQMDMFQNIFFSYAVDIQEVYSDEDMDMDFSDDTLEYESWGAVWHGEAAVKQFLKKHDNPAQIFDADWGDAEESGYILSSDDYRDFLDEEGLTPKGFK